MSRWLPLALLGSALGGSLAGCNPAPAPTPDAAVADGGIVPCTTDADCDDDRFCNGTETCRPTAAAADERGCVPDDTAPCVTGQVCDESMNACVTQCATTEDADGDGARATECGGDDCDDSDAHRYPGNGELCDVDGHDEDCNPATFGDRDLDGDSIVDLLCCNGTSCGEDCDDLRRGISPDSPEVCNGLDDDCDGTVDEGVLVPTWPDEDHDLHGAAGAPSVMHCADTFGFSATQDDCVDTNPAIHAAQLEICDGLDNDCDTRVDEAPVAVTWYLDGDSDGYGSSDPATTRISCTPLPGYSLRATDCDDTRAGVSPGTPEVCDGLDNDCDGSPDFILGAHDTEDDDLDGHADLACPSGDDCDDRDPTSYPSALEICDLRDNDCNDMVDDGSAMGTWWIDRDGDTFGDDRSTPVMSCAPVRGHATRGGDCDDSSAARRPGSTEVCDGSDDDCDGRIDEGSIREPYYLDDDGDGLGAGEPVLACVRPLDRVANANDCDDTNRSVGAASLYFVDVDRDTYGDPTRSELDCTAPMDRVTRGGDCNDADAAIRPMGTEHCGGADEDCDGRVDEDPAASADCTIPGAVAACVAGVCAVSSCSAGRGDCDTVMAGCETTTDTDPNHCGMCGHVCMTGERCRDGECARVVQLAGGYGHVCALLGTGQVACWGAGSNGQMGNGGIPTSSRPPTTTSQMVQLVTGATLDDAIAIASHPNAYFTCALRAGGTVVCWGDNGSLQCGSDAPVTRSVRAVAIPTLANVVAIGVGEDHACAALMDGGLRCWGSNAFGQLGTGAMTPATNGTPQTVVENVGGTPMPVTDAVLVAPLRYSTCFVHRGGASVSCFGREGVGSGWRGQLGRGLVTTGNYPVADLALLPSGSIVTEISSGGATTYEGSTCARLASGRLVCWGVSGDGEISATPTVATPREINAALFTNVQHVWMGRGEIFVAYENASFGPRVAAGGDGHARLGVGTTFPPTGVTLDVAMTPTGYLATPQQIVSGGNYSCALLDTGAVSCWGTDQNVFGDGTTAVRSAVPTTTLVPNLP